eukprot:snap_masked-scaffold617_size123379-processed-gene-0.13 protein:Tk03721 transcript:snap_masked-scaffold617_size123379-processed-gene-0.13-mRNA-1 annotation:"hypothetical protein DAPPUDRAFT_110156"
MILGGKEGSSRYSNETFTLDNSDVLTPGFTLTIPLSALCAVRVNCSHIFVAGGRTTDGERVNTAFFYDTVHDCLIEDVLPMAFGRDRIHCEMSLNSQSDKEFVVAGGKVDIILAVGEAPDAAAAKEVTDSLARTRTKNVECLDLYEWVLNEGCSGSNARNGTCYTLSMTCGSTASENCTYLTQMTATAPIMNPCTYKICKSDPKVCRIRLDFQTFQIADPNVGTVVEVGLASVNNVIVDASDMCHLAIFTLSGSATRSWDIKVTQYQCGNTGLGGDPGCLQFFTGKVGRVASFAFPTSTAVLTPQTQSKPFRMIFKTDETEQTVQTDKAQTNEQFKFPGGIVGFNLDWELQACT